MVSWFRLGGDVRQKRYVLGKGVFSLLHIVIKKGGTAIMLKNRVTTIVVLVSLLVVVFITAASAKTITLKCAGIDPVEHPSTVQMMEMSQEIEALTNNEIKIKVFPAGQLGDWTLLYEEITKGTIDLAVIPIPTTYEKAHEIVYTPYLAKDYKDAQKMFERGSWLYNTCSKLHEGLGVKFLGFQFHGLGGIGSTQPLNEPLNPNESKGILVRVSPLEMESYMLKAIGYNTVSIPYADLYTSFQSGLCDGWYGGSASYSYESFRDVLKHYYALNMYAEATSIVMSKKAWGKLSLTQQNAVITAANNMSAKSITEAEEIDADYMRKLEEAGITVHRYTPEELNANIEKVRKEVWPNLGKFLGEDLAIQMVEEYASK